MKLHLLSLALLGISSVASAGFEVEPNNKSTSATPMVLNETFKGNLEKGSYVEDYYKFTLTEPAEITFHFKNTSDNPVKTEFTLFDSSVRSIFKDSIDPSDTNDNSIPYNLGAGTFFVKVWSNYSRKTNSSYELSAKTVVSETSDVTTPAKKFGIIGTAALPDLNQNGNKDIAVLFATENGSYIKTIDTKTGEQIKEITYLPEDVKLQPISITGFDDIDGNKNPAVVVLTYDEKEKTNTQFIVDVVKGEKIGSFAVE